LKVKDLHEVSLTSSRTCVPDLRPLRTSWEKYTSHSFVVETASWMTYIANAIPPPH